MLTQVFCPGNNKEGFEVAVRILHIAKHTPLVCAVATTNALVPVHRLKKSQVLLRIYIVFDGDEYRTGIDGRINFVLNSGEPPVHPGGHVGRRIRKACLEMPDPAPLSMFENVYAEPTALLREEREQYAAYLDSFVPEEAAQ